jgi:hypothetical protein
LLISKSLPEVVLFSIDLSLKHQKEKMLISVPPLYPFECQVLNLLDQCISKFTSNHNPRKLHLEKIKKLFYPTARYGYDQYMVEFLEMIFKPQNIYFINSDKDRLNYDEIPKQAKNYLCFVLSKDKIYYVDNEKKSFKPLDDQCKPALIRYFPEGFSSRIEEKERNILAIEALTGYKTNQLIEFLHEKYWWNHNPIVYLRDNMIRIIREHQKLLGSAIKDPYRRSDLGQIHAFLLADAKEEIVELKQKDLLSSPSSPFPSSESSMQSSKEKSANDSEFSEEQSAQKDKRASPL